MEKSIQPLSYKVIDSFIDEGDMTESMELFSEDAPSQINIDPDPLAPFPIGCVTLRNTDDVDGYFTVKFSFWSVSKFFAESHETVFGKMDENDIKFFGNEYTRSVRLNLAAGEKGTATYEVTPIDYHEDRWCWEFEVKPGTKTVIVE